MLVGWFWLGWQDLLWDPPGSVEPPLFRRPPCFPVVPTKPTPRHVLYAAALMRLLPVSALTTAPHKALLPL